MKFVRNWGRLGMRYDWVWVKTADIITFNPTERLKRGKIAKKISMDKIKPFTKEISEYELAEYMGGPKFRNGDTIMARITPCLENGKTAQVNILEKDEVGFGSTEFIVMRAIPNVSDGDYIYYLATSPYIRGRAIKSMVGSSGRQRVQQDVLGNVELLVPPLTDQVAIAGVLKMLDAKINQNNKINDNLVA